MFDFYSWVETENNLDTKHNHKLYQSGLRKENIYEKVTFLAT